MIGSSSHVHFLSLLLVLAVIHSVHGAIEDVAFIVAYIAEQTPGGKLFMEKVSKDHVKRLMSDLTSVIWEFIFWQSMDILERVHKISFFIDKGSVSSYSTRIVSYVYEIHLGAEHLESRKDSMEQEIHALLSYEIAHILQNTGNGQIRLPLKDGIAAYVALKLCKTYWIFVKCNDGGIWDQSPVVFGQFLDYCASEYSAFVEKLNKKMEFSYSDDFFVALSDKTVDELWMEYKSKHDSKA